MATYGKADLQPHYRIARDVIDEWSGTVSSPLLVRVSANGEFGLIEIDFPEATDQAVAARLAELLPEDAYVIRPNSTWTHHAP